MTKFDFSHLYKTEEVDIFGLFSVTVREIPHGEYVDLQRKMFGDIHMSKSEFDFQRQLEQIKFDAPGFSDGKNVLAIADWTLKDASGQPVPVSLETWAALPHYITEKIEEAIERLNPDLDENFQEELANAGE